MRCRTRRWGRVAVGGVCCVRQHDRNSTDIYWQHWKGLVRSRNRGHRRVPLCAQHWRRCDAAGPAAVSENPSPLPVISIPPSYLAPGGSDVVVTRESLRQAYAKARIAGADAAAYMYVPSYNENAIAAFIGAAPEAIIVARNDVNMGDERVLAAVRIRLAQSPGGFAVRFSTGNANVLSPWRAVGSPATGSNPRCGGLLAIGGGSLTVQPTSTIYAPANKVRMLLAPDPSGVVGLSAFPAPLPIDHRRYPILSLRSLVTSGGATSVDGSPRPRWSPSAATQCLTQPRRDPT